MTDLWRFSATELADRIRGREVSAREAAEAALARLEATMARCRRDLDQTLQEHFFRIEGLEPDFLPMFMGVKEAP